MSTKELIDWDNFYAALDDEKRVKRARLCFCEDVRPIAEDVYKCEQSGKEVVRAKKIVIRLILDDAARNPELIFENELDGYAYLLQYMVTDLKHLPKKWVPLLEYLVEAGV
ncbi:MAG: hypothetical protein IKL02_05935 [Kiritimatiellae bacterium]|nr:hypothetical protein [Kiritimatiellia bacterium]